MALTFPPTTWAQERPAIIGLSDYQAVTARQLQEIAKAVSPERRSAVLVTEADLQATRAVPSGLDAVPVIYFTPVIRENMVQAFVAGYPLKGSVLNVYFKVSDPSRVFSDGEVFRLNGEKLGAIKFDEKGAGHVELASAETQRNGLLAWLNCVGECIGDANYACNSNPKCALLMVAANVGGSALGAGPLGYISLGMACGGACTSNVNLDLVPGY